jgi:hypothetical protein
VLAAAAPSAMKTLSLPGLTWVLSIFFSIGRARRCLPQTLFRPRVWPPHTDKGTAPPGGREGAFADAEEGSLRRHHGARFERRSGYPQIATQGRRLPLAPTRALCPLPSRLQDVPPYAQHSPDGMYPSALASPMPVFFPHQLPLAAVCHFGVAPYGNLIRQLPGFSPDHF